VTGRGVDGFHKLDKHGNETDENGRESGLKSFKDDGVERNEPWSGECIRVKTDIDLRTEEVRSDIDLKAMRAQQRGRGLPD
jgi:hypothetical protein